jgi:hypothetical protein
VLFLICGCKNVHYRPQGVYGRLSNDEWRACCTLVREFAPTINGRECLAGHLTLIHYVPMRVHTEYGRVSGVKLHGQSTDAYAT